VTLEPQDSFGVPDSVRQEADEAGVDLLLPKPLGDKALRDRANRLIQVGPDGRPSTRTVRPRKDTGVIEASLKELEDRQRDARPEPAGEKQPAAQKDDSQAQELERLREENSKLKRRVVSQLDAIEKLKAELDELK